MMQARQMRSLRSRVAAQGAAPLVGAIRRSCLSQPPRTSPREIG